MNRASQSAAWADQDPLNPILLCDLLDELLVHGLANETSTRLAATPESVRHLPGVRFREARCVLMSGDAHAAINVLQPLMDCPGEIPAGVGHDLAYARFMVGQHDQALQALAAVHGQAGDAEALALLKVRTLHRRQKVDAALEALARINADQCWMRAAPARRAPSSRRFSTVRRVLAEPFLRASSSACAISCGRGAD